MKEFCETDLMKNYRKVFLEREILFWVCYVAFCILGGMNFTSNAILGLYGFFYLLNALLILEKYMTYNGTGNTKVLLSGVLKYHAFDADSYMKEVAGKIILTESIMAIGFCISSACYQRAVLIPWILGLLAIPVLCFFVAKKLFSYRMTGTPSIVAVMCANLAYGLIWIVGIIVLFVFGMMALIVGYGVLNDRFCIRHYVQEMVAYQVYDSMLLPIMIIVYAVLIISVLYGERYKKLKYVSMGLLAAVVLCFMGTLVMDKANNLCITENSIILTKNFEEMTYTFQDVESFQVAKGKDQIDVKLTLKDGNTVNVVGNEFTNTKAWGEKYPTLYNFLSDLTGQLMTAGAKGSIRDVEAIREYVKNYDPECIKGTEEMIAKLQ